MSEKISAVVAAKSCTSCQEIKLLTEFYQDPRRKDGRSSQCKKCRIQYSTDRYHATKDVEKVKYRTQRDAALMVYGGRCAWCNCNETDILEIDHVDGNGNAHRDRETHQALYRRIAAHGAPLTDVRLQLLCKTCHRAKNALETTHRSLAARGVYIGPVIPLPPISLATIEDDAVEILAALSIKRSKRNPGKAR